MSDPVRDFVSDGVTGDDTLVELAAVCSVSRDTVPYLAREAGIRRIP